MISLTVPGEPKGKARARTVRLKNGAPCSYTPAGTALYENLVRLEYGRQCGGQRFADGDMLRMEVDAFFAIPKSASKAKRLAMEERRVMPTKKPDLDNVMKAVADALSGLAYRDDAQIVAAFARKFYSDSPRVDVRISKA